MNLFFAYLIKSSVSLALLYILFRLLTRNDKSHSINRFLLLGILFVSALIPFLNIQFFYEEIPLKQVEVFREFISTPELASNISSTEILPVQETENQSINPFLILYLGFIFALLTRILVSVFSVLRLIQKAEKQILQKIVLAVVKDIIQPFSFLNKIVISKKDFTENKDIVVAHEHAHIKLLHAIDLVVCELFTLLHFFNPFMWLLRRDLKLVHEYQADQAVLQKGIDAKKYQLLVLEKSVGERRFAMANQFTQKPILKRLKMMQQKNRKQWTALKIILFVPLLVLLLQAFARPELITKSADFIPVKYTENETEKWLSKWTAENIGKGFFQPALKSPDAPNKPNNVLVILMNRNDDFLMEDEHRRKEEIKSIVKNYLLGINPDGKNGPDYQEKEISFVGKMKVSKGMIVYKNDLASSKEMINYTLRNIGEACLEVRNEKAQVLFGKDYFDLNEEKQQAVNEVVPVWFSYELPKSPTPNVWLPFDEKPSPPNPINITFKENGNVIVENHKFNSFEDFEKNLKYWNEDLDKYNKNRRGKAFYRAHLFFENYSQKRVKEIDYIMYKNNIHVGQISETSNSKTKFSLEKEKLSAQKDQTLAKAETEKLELLNNKVSFQEEKEGTVYNKILGKKDSANDLRGNIGGNNANVLPPPRIIEIKENGEQDTLPPPPPPPVLIRVNAVGEFYLGEYVYPQNKKTEQNIAWNNPLSEKEIRALIVKKRDFWEKVYENSDTKYDLITSVVVDKGAPESAIMQLKSILREARILHINYSSKKDSIELKSGNSFRINNQEYSIGKVACGNESFSGKGKFEISFFPQKNDKEITLHFISVKSKSVDYPDVGIYSFDSWNYNNRNNNTWWGKVLIENKEKEIASGTLEIIESSTNNLKAVYSLKLVDGDLISGQYSGQVAYNDWRK